MKFTIVYTAEDNGQMMCFGTFATREAAERERDEIEWRETAARSEREWDGGEGFSLAVCQIQPLSAW